MAADSVYGVGDIEMALKRAAKGYVPGVNANHSFRSWGKPLAVDGTAKVIARALPDNAWQRLSAGEGTKGARLHDWAYLGECHKLCVSGSAHAVFRYGHALKRSSNIIAK